MQGDTGSLLRIPTAASMQRVAGIAKGVDFGYQFHMHDDADLDHLTDLLTGLPIGEDIPMSLGEFDGYVAGLITCPEMIPPSEWYPGVFGESGKIIHRDVAGVERLFAALTKHYNRVADVLATAPEAYLPIYEEDINEPGVPLWEPWIAGFERAMRLRADCWVQIVESDDEEAAASVNMILLLVDVHDNTHDHDLDKVEELDRIAPGLLPQLAQAINAWTKPQPPSEFRPPMSDWTASETEPTVYGQKVGRNEPCPCGSGRKYKRCCGGN